MTTIPNTEEFWGVDSYYAFAFPLNSDGSIKAVDLTPYEGLEIDGTRNFNPNPAQGSVVANVGNGRLRDTIYRAPREASRAELTIGYTQQALKAALSNTNVYNVGEGLAIGRFTNQQGSEPDSAFLIVQRGHNENGLTRYKGYFVPRGRIIPRDAAMNENASEETYDIIISNSKKQIWGTSFSVNTHGFTDATYEEIVFEGAPKIIGWIADGIETTFPLPADFPAVSGAKIAVYNFTTGAAIPNNITKSTTNIEFDYPPSTDTLIVAVYEYQP